MHVAWVTGIGFMHFSHKLCGHQLVFYPSAPQVVNALRPMYWVSPMSHTSAQILVST